MKLPYQSSLQFIQRPQLLWNDIGDRKLWRGIQWIRRGPTVPSRLSWNAYQSNIPKPRPGVRWKHGMRKFSEYGNVASRNLTKSQSSSVISPRKSPIHWIDLGQCFPPSSSFPIAQNYGKITSFYGRRRCSYDMISTIISEAALHAHLARSRPVWRAPGLEKRAAS